ncbi:MAG: HAD-IC family P-type ATPase, partial [Candidatus Hydrogenedentes bacterium]|nr:HAD-IC family P-type ATPase [Candidatus Hydrogenedentota bacterium]
GGYTPEGEIHSEEGSLAGGAIEGALHLLLRIGLLNNNARLSKNEEEVWELNGTPTEGALLVAAQKAGLTVQDTQDDAPRLAEIPFSSEFKYMATLHEDTSDAGTVAYVKGAPDRVLSYCSHIMVDGAPVALGEEEVQKVEEALEGYGDQALRLVAAAYKTLPEKSASLDRDGVEEGLTFVGFWGIVDPPRPESIEAIHAAREAGIRIVMITGDHAVTAAAIAREVGIAEAGDTAITGAQLDKMDEQALIEQARQVNVFARVSPAHKLRILKALKAKGAIVAMTGDGVNDAPALKGADIGIAMGKGGTEVAREASDMVLADDNFSTIVHAVEEGRVIFSNLRRVVFFLMTTNLGEVITLALALMIGLPLPLTAIMILWINLVTDGACTIPLGIEPKHWDVLKQPPRASGEGVLDWITLRRMLILAPIIAVGTIGLFAYELKVGIEAIGLSISELEEASKVHAQTVAFTTLAAFQWFEALSARTDKVSVFSVGIFQNLWLWVGILGAVVLQVLVVHTVVGQTLFGVSALSVVDWLIITLVSSSILVVDEGMKIMGLHGRQHV